MIAADLSRFRVRDGSLMEISPVGAEPRTLRLAGGTYGDGIRWIADHLPDGLGAELTAGAPIPCADFVAAARRLPRWPEPGESLADAEGAADCLTCNLAIANLAARAAA